ncbi:hypothetical protein TNCV_3047771 [Trichonephila clavipes]|nr:hypothetical protein TNCV_3047771 [Trichonephila clavipes]
MSSRHRIDDFMRGRTIGKIEEGAGVQQIARSLTSLTALFHGCGRPFKTTECVVEGTERSCSVRCAQKTDISSHQQKKQAHILSRNQFLAASGKQISLEKLLPGT